MNTSRFRRLARRFLITDAPADMGRTSTLDLGDAPVRECAADEPITIAEPTGADIDRQHLRSTTFPTPLLDNLRDIGEITDEQWEAMTAAETGDAWTPPAPPSFETPVLPRRPIDVTDTLSPGGKALAVQRTERMAKLGDRMAPHLRRLGEAVQGAPDVSPERRAAADAYRSHLRTRIDTEREARALGRSARRVGSDYYALDCARDILDRRELSGDARAHLAVVVLAEYLGVSA